MNFVQCNGLRIACRTEGTLDPARPWVVLLHSLATSHRMWDEQVAALAADYRILRIDLRGHGASSVPPGPYSLEMLADDLKSVFDDLLIAQAHVVGLSLGGMVAQAFALRHSIRVRSLVLADTSSAATPDAVSVWEARITQAERFGMASLVESTLERWFTPGFRERDPQRVLGIAGLIRATSAAGYSACAHAVARISLTARLGVIACPALVMVGTEDRATPLAQAEAIARAIAQSRLVRIRHAAHLANVEQPAAFNAELLAFLASAE